MTNPTRKEGTMSTPNNAVQAIPDDAGTLEIFPPAQAHSSTAVAMLHEHAQTYNTAWKLAGQLVRTSMVPKRFFGKQGDATAAILYGAELGLNPIQSLQRVVPIHGMPSLEARTMVGLLKSRGFKVRTVEQSDTSVTVEGCQPDGSELTSSTWTIERAIRAGYVPTPIPGVTNPNPNRDDDWVSVTKTWDGKSRKSVLGNMKYITDPQTMLKAKAQAEVCRELAPEVLMGISYTSEELQSENQAQFDNDRPQPDRAPAAPVTEDEIFAEEVPLDDEPTSAEDPTNTTGNPRPAAEQPSDDQDAPAEDPAPEPTEAPAGAVTEDQGDGAPDTVAPAEQEPVVTDAEVKQAAADRDAKATSKKVAAKRSTAPAADPDRPKSRMRQALEKRLYALLGDAGYSDDANRDGKIALYRGILERPDVTSTNDLDDVAVGKVADQLYAWQQQNALVDEVEAMIAAAVAGESTAPAAADAPTEGSE